MQTKRTRTRFFSFVTIFSQFVVHFFHHVSHNGVLVHFFIFQIFAFFFSKNQIIFGSSFDVVVNKQRNEFWKEAKKWFIYFFPNFWAYIYLVMRQSVPIILVQRTKPIICLLTFLYNSEPHLDSKKTMYIVYICVKIFMINFFIPSLQWIR